MKKIKIYSIVIIMALPLGVIISKFLDSLGVNTIFILIACGLAGGLFGQKMCDYLDKKIN